MMKRVMIAPGFVDQVQSLTSDLPQAIILAGGVGTGLLTMARYIANEANGNTMLISPSEATKTTLGGIGIEVIRRLYTDTRSRSDTKQIVIIDDADLMSEPAQNAFLKLLEEPTKGTHFILTSHRPERLLPTIRSRAPITRVPMITDQQSKEMLSTFKLDDEAIRQALFVGNGLPAELTRLAQNPRARESLVELMRDARSTLSSKRYSALKIAIKYSDSLHRAEQLLSSMERLLTHSLKVSSDPQLITTLEGIIDTHGKLKRSANPKLQLTRFVIQYL